MLPLALLALFLAAQQNPPPPAKPMGSFDDPSNKQPFHSVGVRGTIDAGGYAASASAKTQTEFFEQLTGLQVASLHVTCAPADPSRQQAIQLLQRGDYATAAAALEKLLPTDPQPATRELLGLAYEALGHCGAAAEQFAAASSEPNDLFAQSVALLLEGAIDRAEIVARQAPPSDLLNRLVLGAALFQQGEVTPSLNLFLETAGAHPAEPAPFDFIAIALRSADQAGLVHALTVLNALSNQAPQNPNAHYALACALSSPAAVETELKRALALDPHLAEAHFRLAALAAEHKNLSPAIDEYNAALADNPRLIEAHYRLSQLYTRRGDQQRAKEQLELHQQLRAKQKSDLQNGLVPIVLPASPCESAH